MGHRRRLAVLRRRAWSIVGCGIVVGGAVGTFAVLRPSTSTVSARVLLRTEGSASALDPLATPIEPTTRTRAVAEFADTVTSQEVANRVAARVPHAVTSQLLEAVSVHQIGTTDLIVVTATDASPTGAARIANEFARTSLELRRTAATATYRRAVEDLGRRISALDAQLRDLGQQADAKTASPAASAQMSAAAAESQSLQRRRQGLQDNRALQDNPGELVALASATGAHANPSPVRVATLGGLLFLLLSAGVVTMRELLDDRIRSSDDVRSVTGRPVLAELPRDRASRRDPTHLAVSTVPRSPLSEAVRALRAAIELREAGQRHHTLLITSAARGEGKSLVSANLAVAYAFAGHRVVLVDGDLRTPCLSSVFGNYPARLIASRQVVHGLSGLLAQLTPTAADRSALERAALLRTPIENLLFLPSGPAPANTSDLLDSNAMAMLLEDLARLADIVIVDSAPLLPVGDAVGLALRADAVVLVASVRESRRRELRRSEEILASHPHRLGIIVNQVTASTTYASHRRGTRPWWRRSRSPAPIPRGAQLGVVDPLEVPEPPMAGRDANGDIWIDLSDEPEKYATTGAATGSSWDR